MYQTQQVNLFATLAKIGIGIIIDRTAPQLTPIYHATNIATARNPVDFAISTASLATCKIVQQSTLKW